MWYLHWGQVYIILLQKNRLTPTSLRSSPLSAAQRGGIVE